MSVRCLWLEKQKALNPPVPKVSLRPGHRRQYRPHCEPDAHLTVFAAIFVTAAEHKLLEEPPDYIHDCKSRRDSDECKRKFLRLEQFVDARQSLVNVNLAPVSSRSPQCDNFCTNLCLLHLHGQRP